MTFEIGFLRLDNGKAPFVEWEQKLDNVIRASVRVRINRLRLGNFGDCKPIKGVNGIYELRVHVGAGYRIYFGKSGDKLIILICGGDKGSQKKDIVKAKEYWYVYKNK